MSDPLGESAATGGGDDTLDKSEAGGPTVQKSVEGT